MPGFTRVVSSRRIVALVSCAFVSFSAGSAAKADEPAPAPVSLPPVVVSATLVPTPASQIGSSVTVVTGEDIAQKQNRTLPEILNDVPGLNVVQSGGPGGVTSVFIRGTNANHTKVLLDGIDISDPSSPNGAVDFSQILASNIERVEVLRGPQSGLYGSDAIGGVISITTKAGSGPPQLRGMIEGGSFSTFNQTAGVSGSMARFSYNFDVAHYHTGDTQVTPLSLVVPGRTANPDYYDNKTLSTRLGVALTDNFDVGAVLRYVDTHLNSTNDDFLGPEAATSYSSNHELFGRTTAHLVLFDGAFEQTVGLGYTSYQRRLYDPNPGTLAFGNDPSDTNGTRTKLDWRGVVKLVPGEVLVLGAEHQTDRLDDTEPVSAHVTNDAGYIELQSSLGERLFNTASVRFDENGAVRRPADLSRRTGLSYPGDRHEIEGQRRHRLQGPDPQRFA